MSRWRGLAVATLAVAWAIPVSAARAAGRTDDESQGSARRARVIRLHQGGGHLGVSLGDLESDDVKRLGLADDRGALVREVAEESPAAKAGLKADDVIVAFEGEVVRSAAHLARLVRETPAGRTVSVTVSRGGARQDLKATLDDARPLMRLGEGLKDLRIEGLDKLKIDGLEDLQVPEPPEPPLPGREGLALGEMFRARPRLGIQYVELTDQLARYFKVADGVLVSSVSAGSPAEKAGLRAGDVIVKVDGDDVSSGRDLLRVVRAASDGEITLGIQREGHAMDLRVRLEPRTPRRPKEPTT